MNARQLAKLGVPQDCVPEALQVVQAVAEHDRTSPVPSPQIGRRSQ